jgi:hypothetical protein
MQRHGHEGADKADGEWPAQVAGETRVADHTMATADDHRVDQVCGDRVERDRDERPEREADDDPTTKDLNQDGAGRPHKQGGVGTREDEGRAVAEAHGGR